jgi:nucleoside-specific outer membrane channel protein Tsx
MKTIRALRLHCAATLGLLFSLGVGAENNDLLLWQDNSLSALSGNHFRVDPQRQNTLTFEHASGWTFGDLFLFIDSTHFKGQPGSATYGEISPRLSLGKLRGQPLEFGPIRDVLLAATYEFGEGPVQSLLLGPGFDLAVPGFKFFQLNFYQRLPQQHQAGRSWQITPVWSLPIAARVTFDGFMDYVVENDGNYQRNWHFNPQLKYDLGSHLGLNKGQVLAGIEYSYWHNKYGIADTPAFRTTQSVSSLLLQVHF